MIQKMNFHFNFMRHAPLFLMGSCILTVIGVGIIVSKGFYFGIDFSGGHELQIQFANQTPDLSNIRSFLEEEDFKNTLVQSFGNENEILIRMQNMSSQKIADFSKKLLQKWSDAKIRRVDSVGPQIGNELKRKGLLAVLYALLLILIYLSLRFDFKYAPSAVFCLFHDSVITMAIFSFFDKEVNIQTLAAVLAIIGYSLNDTIVTFDRIRENVDLYSNKESFTKICNRSLNEVLSRTLLTSVTTMIAVLSMWFFTQGVIKDFAFTLGIGILVGTYSSIYVATPLTAFFAKISKNSAR